jgi:peptide chain release factor subunit 1
MEMDQELLFKLKNFAGKGTELISLYVPDNKQSQAAKLLRDELGKCSSIKSRSTRQSVEAGIKSTLEKLKLASGDVAIFVGPTSEGWISEIVEVPKPLSGIIYRCGSTFFLEPIDKMRERGPKYAIICLDLHEAVLAFLQGTHIDVVFSDESIIPNKMSRGGQSARRFEKNRQIAIKAWFNGLSDKVNDILMQDIESLAGVIISGPGLTKNDFYQGEFLHHEIRKKIIGVVDTGYVGDQGIKETINGAEDLLQETELISQRKMMKEFFRRLAKDEKITYARVEEDVLGGRVETLLLSKADKKLEEVAAKFGAKVVIIATDFEEGKQLKEIFGGKVGLLRY